MCIPACASTGFMATRDLRSWTQSPPNSAVTLIRGNGSAPRFGQVATPTTMGQVVGLHRQGATSLTQALSNLQPNKTYVVRALVSSSAQSTLQATVAIKHTSIKPVVVTPPNFPKWTALALKFTTPPNTTSMDLTLSASGLDTANETCFVADVSVEAQ